MSPYSSTSPHALATLFARQTIADDARQTLSSWDSCMSKAYCKWPVIAVIIVGSLIVLSLVLCLARFCCCGVECCCACCSCFNACCPKPRRSRTKYVEAPQYPPPQQYGYTPPMNYGGPAPQYATYDVSKTGRVKEDALPVMPSWQTSQSKRIEDTSYHGADDVPASDFGHGGQSGIAMGVVGGNTRGRTKDDDPVYREDDQLQPMLHQQQHEHDPRPISPYNDSQQADNYASAYTPDLKSNPYALSSTTGSTRTQTPQHNYNDYRQQTPATAYGGANPQSPSSTYSSAYPQQYPSRAPTYRSQAPTYRIQAPAQERVMSPISPSADYNYSNTANTGHAGTTGYANTNNTNYADFSRGQSQSTRYEPTVPQSPSAHAELPGSLAIGGAASPPTQRFYSQPQHEHEEVYEMSDGRSIYRKPVG